MPDDDALPRCPAYEAPMQLGMRVSRILGCGRRTSTVRTVGTVPPSITYSVPVIAAVFHALMGAGPERGSSLVVDERLLGEAARHGCALASVSVEVGGDRLGKTQAGHSGLLRSCLAYGDPYSRSK